MSINYNLYTEGNYHICEILDNNYSEQIDIMISLQNKVNNLIIKNSSSKKNKCSILLSDCISLVNLIAPNCNLDFFSIIDDSGINLEIIDFHNNKIVDLDLSTCNNMNILICDNNKLEQLIVSSNKLSDLYCQNNNLTEIDLSRCKNIKQLICSSNNLSNLNWVILFSNY